MLSSFLFTFHLTWCKTSGGNSILLPLKVYAIIVSKPENGELSPASVSYTAGFYHIPVIGISSRDSAFSDKVGPSIVDSELSLQWILISRIFMFHFSERFHHILIKLMFGLNFSNIFNTDNLSSFTPQTLTAVHYLVNINIYPKIF